MSLPEPYGCYATEDRDAESFDPRTFQAAYYQADDVRRVWATCDRCHTPRFHPIRYLRSGQFVECGQPLRKLGDYDDMRRCLGTLIPDAPIRPAQGRRLRLIDLATGREYTPARACPACGARCPATGCRLTAALEE